MSLNWPEILTAVTDGAGLTRQQANAAMAEVLAGNASDAQLAGLIVGLRVKSESTEEMVGMVQAMHEAAAPLSLPAETIDIVGTGGSAHRRKHALNVSTMACFVASAAGATVCKHGNYKASSTSGAFNFLEAIGLRIDLTPSELEACVDEVGIGFAFARTFHPAMRHAGPVRAELGIPTVFNVLGPLAHPGKLRRQVVGTPSPELGERMAQVLHELGSELAWVVTGADGLDELSTTGPNIVQVVTPEGVNKIEISPTEVGIAQADSIEALAGGSPEANAAIFDRLLGGETGPARDIVVLNAAAGLVVSGRVDDLGEAVQSCGEALDKGLVAEKLELLKTSISN